MFGRKKHSATITEKDPMFEARYLGNVETFTANGKGCAIIPVQKLWDNSPSERHLKKVLMVISASGIVLKDHKKEEGKKFGIENITFCNADKIAEERVFCWIWKVPGVRRLECHAVLCGSRETARAMALVLSRAFHVAYRDWRANRGRQMRQQHTQLQEKRGEKGSEEAPGGMNGLLPGCVEGKSGVATRRGSTTSSCSGFESSEILDPEDEEWMRADERVQAIVRGERDSGLGSD
ncbi:protein FAM43A-like [Haliotis rufescens]|uniref:protein FAM43A-like n=1 Tax=Haliotis rufescens TaxID=6454 RepID=UPI00201F5B83|nr:protein FAM43A-like [Haliotis rufescens]